MIPAFLRWLVGKLQQREITAEGEELYLLRSKLRGWMPGDQKKYWWSLYLHRFFLPDLDRALHNHPWRWAVSLVLSGGYTEERRLADGRVITRRLGPLSVNLLRHDSFHRIAELHGEPWTLFLVGPKVSTWGFLEGGKYIPWRDRLRARGIEPSY